MLFNLEIFTRKSPFRYFVCYFVILFQNCVIYKMRFHCSIKCHEIKYFDNLRIYYALFRI